MRQHSPLLVGLAIGTAFLAYVFANANTHRRSCLSQNAALAAMILIQKDEARITTGRLHRFHVREASKIAALQCKPRFNLGLV